MQMRRVFVAQPLAKLPLRDYMSRTGRGHLQRVCPTGKSQQGRSQKRTRRPPQSRKSALERQRRGPPRPRGGGALGEPTQLPELSLTRTERRVFVRRTLIRGWL